jgi:2-isopropylmalate synthase
MGHDLDDERFLEVFARFKQLADRKKTVNARDLAVLATGAQEHAPAEWTLQQLQVACGTHVIPTATVQLRDPHGVTRVASATGSGPVDASCRAVNALVGDIAELQGFTVRNVSEGAEALGEVTVRIKDFHTAETHVGHGAHTDVVTASAEAYIDAINSLVHAKRHAKADPVESHHHYELALTPGSAVGASA